MAITVLTHLGEHSAAAIRERHPGVEAVAVPMDGPVPEGVSGEVLLTLAKMAANLAEVCARGVRWVHEVGTGVDQVPLEVVLADGADRVLTSSPGASAVPISEWVLAQMLAAEKQLPESWVEEPPELWNIGARLGELAGRTLGLVGLGGIGSRVARLALAFEMRVVAIRRSDSPSPVDGVRVVTELQEVLAAADHLVLAAPATADTRHLIDAAALRHVRPGVHLVNVARGALVDQEALRVALDDGRVARASLDVCTPEPLPAGHWMYAHPAVRLSPHISWSSPHSMGRLMDDFHRNLDRYVAGEPLAGVVDPERGY